jgi:hypothetical protein
MTWSQAPGGGPWRTQLIDLRPCCNSRGGQPRAASTTLKLDGT